MAIDIAGAVTSLQQAVVYLGLIADRLEPFAGGIIAPENGGTGVANGAAETITLTGGFPINMTLTGSTGVTFPTSGTLAITGNPLSQFAATTSAQLSGVISDETGTGVLVFATTPTLTTPRTTQFTVGTLPAAATAGATARAFVTDANTTLTAGIGTVVAGGGANFVPVFSDATNWIIG